MQWNKQVGNITTSIKVKVDFTLTELSATDVVTWSFHVDDFAKGRYNMILGQDLLTELGLNLKLQQVGTPRQHNNQLFQLDYN